MGGQSVNYPLRAQLGGNQIVHQKERSPAAQSGWFNDRVKLFELNFTGAGPQNVCDSVARFLWTWFLVVNGLVLMSFGIVALPGRPERPERPRRPGPQVDCVQNRLKLMMSLDRANGFFIFHFSLSSVPLPNLRGSCRSFVFVLFNKFILLLALQCVMPSRLQIASAGWVCVPNVHLIQTHTHAEKAKSGSEIRDYTNIISYWKLQVKANVHSKDAITFIMLQYFFQVKWNIISFFIEYI